MSGPGILVVEDNPSNAACLSAMLEAVGYDAVVATTAREALDCLARERPSAVLLDLHLPDMHGGTILRKIRTHPLWDEIPVIIITASDKFSDLERALACGANGYVTKPVQPTRLLAKLAEFARPWSTGANDASVRGWTALPR